MQRIAPLCITLLFACEIATKLGDHPADETDTKTPDPSSTSDTGVPSTESGISTSSSGASTEGADPDGGGTTGSSCPSPTGEPCPPPPEDWCEYGGVGTVGVPEWLAEYWETFCEPGATTGDPAESCVIDGVATPNCPPPPLDWCTTTDRPPLPEGLAEFWDSFCAASTTGAGGDPDTDGDTDSPPETCLIGGEVVEECPPPPEDWCTEGSPDAALPEGLAEYWDTFCSEDTDADTDSAEETGPDGVPQPCVVDGELVEVCPLPPAEWCALDEATRQGFPLPDGLGQHWDTFCEDGTSGT